jgi:site-specific DNA recombinase
MLHRELYRGQIVWNKMQRIDRGGTRSKRARPQSEWLVLPAPELRIVPEDLWRATHASLGQKQAAYARVTGGRLVKRPEGSRESPYLLTGIPRCGLCGGSIYASRRTHGRHERFYYGCFYHRSRGAVACANALTAPQDEVNAEVLTALRRDVLVPATAEEILSDTVAAWREQARRPGASREELEDRRHQLVVEIGHLTDALARRGAARLSPGCPTNPRAGAGRGAGPS